MWLAAPLLNYHGCVSDEPARVRPEDVDIGALLGVALGPPPSPGLADKVGTTVTLMTTVTELALLLFAAPLSWLRADTPEDSDRDRS